MAVESTTVGKVVYKVELDTSALDSGAKNVEKELRDVGKSSKDISNTATSFDSLAQSIAGVVAAAKSLEVISSMVGDVTDAYSQYQSAMMGVQSVARSTGNDVRESMEVIKNATSSGLVTEADAAVAVKNLLSIGYSAEMAGNLINSLTDAAAFNRQAHYSLSEAVRVTTEGIRLENSVLSDAAGAPKNIAKMYEEYAASLGKTTEQLTQQEKNLATYNGFLNETANFTGDAEKYSQTLAGSQQKLDLEINKVKQSMGSLFEQFAPVLSGLAQWISENRGLVAGIATTAAVILTGGGILTAIKTLTAAIKVLGLTSKGALGFLGAILALAIGAGIVIGDQVSNLGDLSDQYMETGDAATGFGADTETMSKEQEKAAKKVANLQEQLAKLKRDYERDLKEIGVKHRATLDDLTKQIEEANVDYKQKVDERNAEFEKNQIKEEIKHQEKVDELMTQLNFLQRYNNAYNREKLAQVQFALAKEQNLYQQQTMKEKAELDIRNAADKQSLDQRLESLQAELADEMDFMNKHREDLNSVRHVILLDEIESLQERYREQQKSYQDQIAEAGKSGTAAGNAYAGGVDGVLSGTDYQNRLRNDGDIGGQNFVDGFMQVLGTLWNQINNSRVLKPLQDGLQGFFENTYLGIGVQMFYNVVSGKSNLNSSLVRNYVRGGGSIWGFASGGYTGQGSKNEVAGIVHRGEYVLPQEMVDQSTGTPKLGQPLNITINMSGLLATSDQAKRELAMDLSNALNQELRARSLS